MAVLVLGLLLFLGIHSVRIAASDWRDRVVATRGGGPYKGIYSAISLVGFILIIWGFVLVSGDNSFVYAPPSWGPRVAAVLMFPALVLLVASGAPTGYIKRAVGHPLLIATVLWAVAHLLANGDLAGVVLFGAFLVWSIVDWIVQPRVTPVGAVSARSDLIAVAVGAVLYGLFVWRLHFWLFGVDPLA